MYVCIYVFMMIFFISTAVMRDIRVNACSKLSKNNAPEAGNFVTVL